MNSGGANHSEAEGTLPQNAAKHTILLVYDVTLGGLVLMIVLGMILTGCENGSRPPPTPDSMRQSSDPSLPLGLDSAMVALLTETLESEHFIYHFEPGDTVSADRQEALHRWVVDYLDISLPKKIDYYKFTFENIGNAIGRGASGRGFPQHYALATMQSWHPHEAMHIYTYALCEQSTIRLFDEGMAVAHEFDPLNDDWVSHWRLWHGDRTYVYAEKVRNHRAAGRLYAIEEILESRAFDDARRAEAPFGRVLYDQAGMFVSYLISTFGIETMKEAICSVTQNDARNIILQRFEEAFGISVQQAEQAWLAYLDSSM